MTEAGRFSTLWCLKKKDKGADTDLTLKFCWPYDWYHIIFLAIPSFRAQTALHMALVVPSRPLSLVNSGRYYRHIKDS